MDQKISKVPARIAVLPQDHRGFHIPWFVARLPDGSRDFRFADPAKKGIAVRTKKCWVCGGTLGTYFCFVIGPMCAVTRTTAEPPCHQDCAQYSVKICPFLTKPRMRRNDKDLEEFKKIGAEMPPGFAIMRNPGATCLWTCRDFKTFKVAGDNSGDFLIRIGEPGRIEWYAEGRPATKTEVLASIDSGFPLLEKEARAQGLEAVKALQEDRREVEDRYIPKS
jgi:hypothetical protein